MPHNARGWLACGWTHLHLTCVRPTTLALACDSLDFAHHEISLARAAHVPDRLHACAVAPCLCRGTCWRAAVWPTCPVDLTGTFLSLQTSSSRCKVRFRGLKPSPLHTYPALPAGTAPAGVAGVAAVLPGRGPCSA